MIILGLIALFYGSMILGSIILIIWAIRSRLKKKNVKKLITKNIKNTNFSLVYTYILVQY